MSNRNKNIKSPLVVLALVFVAAIFGGCSNNNPNNLNKNVKSNVNKSSTPTVVNEPGANPPNRLGSETATVTVEEFADFQCPTCGVKHPLMKEIVSAYGNRIKFIFRDYPLAIAAHDKAYDAAVAAEAAGLQGKFWDMQNQLYTNQQKWTADPNYRTVWEGYATGLGLDLEKFKTDMAGSFTKGRVDADLKRGRALGVNSTPSVFINGMLVPFEQMTSDGMRQIIDGELAKSQTSQPNQSNPNAATGGAANQANK